MDGTRIIALFSPNSMILNLYVNYYTILILLKEWLKKILIIFKVYTFKQLKISNNEKFYFFNIFL